MIGYVYILQCNNGRYYVGSTSDIQRRFEEHSRGKNKATKNLLPVRLIFYQHFSSLGDARRIEYKLKSWKSRQIIEKIVASGYIQV